MGEATAVHPSEKALESKSAEQEHEFRDYSHAKPRVVEFYRKNHELQTLEFVLAKKKQYGSLSLGKRGVWYRSISFSDHSLSLIQKCL
jgi:hypothetical protein